MFTLNSVAWSFILSNSVVFVTCSNSWLSIWRFSIQFICRVYWRSSTRIFSNTHSIHQLGLQRHKLLFKLNSSCLVCFRFFILCLIFLFYDWLVLGLRLIYWATKYTVLLLLCFGSTGRYRRLRILGLLQVYEIRISHWWVANNLQLLVINCLIFTYLWLVGHWNCRGLSIAALDCSTHLILIRCDTAIFMDVFLWSLEVSLTNLLTKCWVMLLLFKFNYFYFILFCF